MAILIVKCIERCNANCVYCEVVRSHVGIPDMSLEMLDTVFMRINEFLSENLNENVTFTWHGGEPLLLGVEYFARAHELQDRRCKNTQDRIQHLIQSNITLVNEAHISALKQLGINHIGSSYDSEPQVRGFGSHVDSIAYNRAFLRGTTILEQHNMSWGIIYVVTRKSLKDPLSVFLTLANLRPAHGFMMNPVVIDDESRQEIAISPREYADFLGETFSFWYAHRERYPKVEPFASLWETIVEKRMRLFCSESGNCHYTHLNIDPTGEVSQCGRSSDLHIMKWGNIEDSSIEELFSRSCDQLRGRLEHLKEGECKGCRLFPICHGGCPIDAYVSSGHFDRKTGWCEARKRFIYDYFEPITGIKVENVRDEH
jgi:uncharacterized protein